MFRPEYKPKLSPIMKAEAPPVAKEWTFNFDEILSSPRKVKGKFHTPMLDKDNEYVQGEAVRNAVPDFMHLPILHDFHKERTVGIVTRVVELSDGSFDFEGLIKATDDCNDVWDLIEKGNYDQVSIYGKRTCGSESCSMRPEARKEPCVTTAVRLDSISVCDEKARNEGTSLYVAKGAKVVFNANEELIKAETTDSSLMHTVTDKPKKGYKINSKGEVIRTDTPNRATCPLYERQELGKGEDMNEVKAKNIANPMEGSQNPRGKDKPRGKFDSMGRNYRPPSEEKKGDEMEEASVEGEVEESIEEKLDKLEMVIEGLVQKDQEAKAIDPYENYSDKSPEIQPSDVDQGELMEPEVEENYGAPEEGEGREIEVKPTSDIDHMAAKIHLSKKVEEEKCGTCSEKKAVPRISLTDRKTTSPEEVEHWKKQYEAGKGEYQAQQAAKIAEQEAMKQEPKVDPNERLMDKQRQLRPDSGTIDAKADPNEPEPHQDTVKPVQSVHAWKDKKTESGDTYSGKQQKEAYKKDLINREKSEATTSTVPRIDPERPEAKQAKDYNEHREEGKPPIKTFSTGDEVVHEEVPKQKNKPEKKETSGGKKLGSEAEAKENLAKIPPSKVEDTKPTDKKKYATTDIKSPKTTSFKDYKPPTEAEGEESERQSGIRSTAPPWSKIGGKPTGTERMKPRELEDPSTKQRQVGSYESESGAVPEQDRKRVTEGNYTTGKPAERGSAVTDKEKYGKWSSTPGEKKHPEDATKEPRFVPEKKAGEMPDINSRLDRLIAVVAQLVQSDEKVHEEMDSPMNEEEKAISKGTETMKDEEVDLLVKAKVDAKVEEISKAYIVQVEELKKANTDLEARIAKMENETIEKSGVAVILREGDGELGTVLQSNAAAISAISKAQKSKV